MKGEVSLSGKELKGITPDYEPGWHIQVRQGDFVSYGYEKHDRAMFLAADNILFDEGTPLEHRVEFELPEPWDDGTAYKIFERHNCWGARVRANTYIHEIKWILAETMESAIELAKEDLKRRAKSPDSELLTALEDVRLMLW